MGRRRRGRPVSGWLNLDKAAGQTSTAAVATVRRLFQAARTGHAGTLDPLATGILPIALGEATKSVAIVQAGLKTYRFCVRWGVQTTTDDGEGFAMEHSSARPDAAAIIGALAGFTGDIMQRPPAFSAIKVHGERAYDLAREGAPPDLPARPVSVERFELTARPDADHATFECVCGTGTYVRALARDIGRELGCFGHVSALHRTAVGPFDEARSVELVDLEATAKAGDGGLAALDAVLKPISFALADMPEIAFSASDAARLSRGQQVLLRGRDAPVISGMAHATHAGVSVAIGEVSQGAFQPRRVFLGQSDLPHENR